ncbi:hypothetical protein [Streptomyces sp. SLBN-115]|uniref:hypothetical protein n=1 Tax=Streptomyces sp. SLBN-115 TaxID=2768453 RepID=UPI00190F74D1|nr:hypothetical protein [Streptomyces sp. SLBN-115]
MTVHGQGGTVWVNPADRDSVRRPATSACPGYRAQLTRHGDGGVLRRSRRGTDRTP